MMSGAYSDDAMQKKVEGTVVVCVTVDAHGEVTNVLPGEWSSGAYPAHLDRP
jgi:hypothetical protein